MYRILVKCSATPLTESNYLTSNYILVGFPGTIKLVLIKLRVRFNIPIEGHRIAVSE